MSGAVPFTFLCLLSSRSICPNRPISNFVQSLHEEIRFPRSTSILASFSSLNYWLSTYHSESCCPRCCNLFFLPLFFWNDALVGIYRAWTVMTRANLSLKKHVRMIAYCYVCRRAQWSRGRGFAMSSCIFGSSVPQLSGATNGVEGLHANSLQFFREICEALWRLTVSGDCIGCERWANDLKL